MFNLEGRRILVTGATSGIGRACARMAMSLGAKVIAVGRNQEALDSLGATLSIRCDITRYSEIDSMVNQLTGGGKIDGFVHAAGVSFPAPLKGVDMGEAQKLFSVNYFSFLDIMKHVANVRNAAPGFSVVAISSVASLAGWGGVSVYAGSKGALNATVRALAMEFAPKGWRVNAVLPSNIKTPMFDSMVDGLGEDLVKTKILSKQPLGIGVPDDVAGPVCFLLSSAASFITGVCLPVDGGFMAQ